MKLESFKEKNRKKTGIIVFTICCILLIAGVLFYNSFALFDEKKNFNVINGNVEDPGDLYFAYYIDDEIAYDMPSKDSGYTLSNKSICTNGVTISWDDNTWTAVLNYQNYQENSNSRTKCNLYFEKITFAEAVVSCGQSGVDAATCIKANKNLDTKNLKEDNTVDNNLRFVGESPNNYIDIGDRDASGNIIPWRIIGSMNNVDDGNGNKETRLKIIRSESIGAYSWDTSDLGVVVSINDGYGINEWSQADIMKLLNPGYESETVGGSLYWNSTSGNCYNRPGNGNTACDFTSSGLSNDAKSYIGETLWHTGSNGSKSGAINVSKFYELEKSNNIGKICTSGDYCNDTVERTTTWNGFVGLMSPSDYGYATSGGNEADRETCIKANSWNGLADCINNDWLYNSSFEQWTMMPSTNSSYANYVFAVVSGDTGGGLYSCYAFHARPVVYLKASTKIVSGDGTLDNMFVVK